MRYIKIFEEFFSGNKLNESKEVPLPGGFINLHTDDSNSSESSSSSLEPGVLYFITNLTDPSKHMGTPLTLDITRHENKGSVTLTFPSENWAEDQKNINLSGSNYDKLIKSGKNDEPAILAKTPEEATSKAYEILGYLSNVAGSFGDPKTIGNLIRAFFEIRKLYPAYATKNLFLKGFLQGIINGKDKPDWGIYKEVPGYGVTTGDWTYSHGQKLYGPEIKKALEDAGVAK
jgi:hypothetical protein